MVKKLNRIWIPSSYQKVDLPKEDTSRKDFLAQYDGKFILVSDLLHCANNGYLFVRLRVDANNKECYYAQRISDNGTLREIRMHYNDLEGLLIPSGDGILFRHDF